MMTNERLETDKKSIDDTGIQRTEMQKEIVISRLREMGCRITRQRMILHNTRGRVFFLQGDLL